MAERNSGRGDGVGVRSLSALLTDIARSPRATSDLVDAAGELADEDARYNAWCYSRKPRSSTVELWNMAALAGHVRTACESGWTEYLAADGKPSVHDELLAVLRTMRTRLSESRTNDHVDFEDPDIPEEIRDWD